MATHYSCDRCGAGVGVSHTHSFYRDALIKQWVGDGSLPPRDETVQVTVKAIIRGWEDPLDLCRLCQIDLLLSVVDQLRATDDYHRAVATAKTGHTYTVQVLDEHTWHDCTREDIQDLDGNPHADLPARFDLLNEAEGFIKRLRGLMHTGGSDTQFRVIHTEHPDQVVLVARTA